MTPDQAQAEISLLAAYEYEDAHELIGAVHTLKSISLALRSDWEGEEGVTALVGIADALALDLGGLAGIPPILPRPLFGDWTGETPEIRN